MSRANKLKEKKYFGGNMKKTLFVLAFSLLVTGCIKEYTEITEADISHAFIMNSSPTFQGYYYLGSDAAYHYFRSKWKYGHDKYFKIAVKNLTLSITQPLNKNEIRIYRIPPDTKAQVLFRTSSFKIYINRD